MFYAKFYDGMRLVLDVKEDTSPATEQRHAIHGLSFIFEDAIDQPPTFFGGYTMADVKNADKNEHGILDMVDCDRRLYRAAMAAKKVVEPTP